ncbi:glucose-1-phosphate adenylyltransferase [candidate division KSB1 bacterium]|nr:glucose-1-phosphate adenylyltransferase [candidate division KSB1 bacterium]
MKRVLALLLAGGVGSRLNVLAKLRAKPAVPFGGIYRIIDFTLSNIVNSGFFTVGVLTQYKPYSLMKHIGTGIPWDFIGRNRTAKILPPATGEKNSDWYQGTADAIYQNLPFIKAHNPKYTLVLSGDHIYHADYNQLIEFHEEKDAQITIPMMEIPLENAHHFGLGITNAKYRITGWEEKPKQPHSNLASMGIYVFNTDYLVDILANNVGIDFGKHIIPHAIDTTDVYAYPFKGYWQDVGTFQAYWEANMDLLNPHSKLNLKEWQIYTNVEEEETYGDRGPSYFDGSAHISNSMISPQCIIEGTVENSILSPGVRVKKGAIVKNSIIMHDCTIDPSSKIDYSILDKNVIVGSGAKIGSGDIECPNEKTPSHLNSGLTVIGKSAIIPQRLEIGRNCIVHPYITEDNFESDRIKCGSTIEFAL